MVGRDIAHRFVVALPDLGVCKKDRYSPNDAFHATAASLAFSTSPCRQLIAYTKSGDLLT